MGVETGAARGRQRIEWRYPQIRRRRQFLRTLAETYDMEAALAAARMSWPDLCRLRSLYPEFAAEFEETLAAGYDRLEIMLLRQAGLGQSGIKDHALAQALLKQRRAMKTEARPRPSSPQQRAAMIKAMLDKLGPTGPARPAGRQKAGRLMHDPGAAGGGGVAAAAGAPG